MPKIRISGRFTRLGAETSAYPLTEKGHVEVVAESKSGSHWVEEITGEPGFEFTVIDITNSGKHHCFRGKIGYDDSYEVVLRHEDHKHDHECSVCGGRFRNPPLTVSKGDPVCPK